MATGSLIEPSQYFVTDTSSFIAVREVVPVAVRPAVFGGMRSLVTRGELVYPSEVIDELTAHARSPDPILDLVRANRDLGTRFGFCVTELAEVMRHPIAHQVVDVDKSSGPEEADPHVLALALFLKKQGKDIVVVTEETRDRPGRVSMATACGALRLIRLPLKAFLADRNIWSG